MLYDNPFDKIRISPGQLIPVSFLATILAGALLLMLPISTASGHMTDFVTALFTSTTSVCVTGLVVVDTYSYWSMFGQFVILVLIQIGGLGVITVTSMIMLISKKKFHLGNRLLLGDSLNIDSTRGLLHTLTRIFKGVFLVEAIGAILCAIRIVPVLGLWQGLWASLFQSVSAFCNAGMDVIGPNSMIDFHSSRLLMITVMLLIILGGLGFVVWFDLIDEIKNAYCSGQGIFSFFGKLHEHSKIVLLVTAGLIIFGAACIFVFEGDNPETLGAMSVPDRILNSLFESVTFRTAGFASFPQESMNEISCVIGCIIMFIGGSPVGTAGGVKTVTVFLFFMNALSYIRGRKENVVFNRRVPEEMMRKSSAIVFVSMTTVCVMTILLMTRGGIVFTDALFEVVSALATVGLSRALTPHLDTIGRIIIIISMYLGRIGPISMAIFFSKGSGYENRIKHAEGKFYVG